MHVSVYLAIHECVGDRLTSDVLLIHAVLHVLEHDLILKLEFSLW